MGSKRRSEKILGIILARKQSGRLKNKHLIRVGGKPLIYYTFDYALKSRPLDDIACSTDCRKIAALAKSSRINVIKRPSALARPDSHIIDALRHALAHWYRKHGIMPGVTVILLGNVPCRGSTIEKGLDVFYTRMADSVFTVCKVAKYHPEWMFKGSRSGRIIFDKKSLRYRCQDLPDYYIATDSFIISRTEVLLNKRPRTNLYSDFGKRLFFIEEPRNSTIDVDDIHDLEYAKFMLSGKRG